MLKRFHPSVEALEPVCPPSSLAAGQAEPLGLLSLALWSRPFGNGGPSPQNDGPYFADWEPATLCHFQGYSAGELGGSNTFYGREGPPDSKVNPLLLALYRHSGPSPQDTFQWQHIYLGGVVDVTPPAEPTLSNYNGVWLLYQLWGSPDVEHSLCDCHIYGFDPNLGSAWSDEWPYASTSPVPVTVTYSAGNGQFNMPTFTDLGITGNLTTQIQLWLVP
jgi:hypothetical protein